MSYGLSTTTNLSFEQAIEKVTQELKTEGFGVLTTIDVKETLKKKLDVDFKKYVILGACNPPFAFKALQTEEEIGLLLPCNVIVYERNDNVVVSVFNPLVMMRVLGNDAMEPIADDLSVSLPACDFLVRIRRRLSGFSSPIWVTFHTYCRTSYQLAKA